MMADLLAGRRVLTLVANSAETSVVNLAVPSGAQRAAHWESYWGIDWAIDWAA